ncbi:MAG: hypothetical protein LBQ54_07220 [Planctomycetaceae bacterium]|jgi:hypothetical protein|nr:hypothetical protein [Planctomycetaceae bacterium]
MRKLLIGLTVLGMTAVPMFTFGQSPRHHEPQKAAPNKFQTVPQKPGLHHPQMNPMHKPQTNFPQQYGHIAHPAPIRHPVLPAGKPEIVNHYYPVPTPSPVVQPVIVPRPDVCEHASPNGLSIILGGPLGVIQFNTKF